MKRKAHIILLVLLLLCVLSTTAFAIDESEVESAIAASSKEEVAGNVFIWFLCAIGFLKVSQKIDSFMASLGINVGRTGGSMLTELMVAGRGIAAVAGAVGGTVFNHHSSSNSTHTNPEHPDRYREMPLLGDIYEILMESPETRRMGNILNRLVNGSAKTFNQHTNVQLDNLYTVLDISELTGELLPVGMFVALDYVWDKAKEDRTKEKAIFIDEAWELIGDDDTNNPNNTKALAGEWVQEIFKIIRGYGGAAIAATQDIGDLDRSRFGKGILNVAKTKIILNLENDEAQRVQHILHLSDAEIMSITRFERGQGLISTNSNHITVSFKASPLEKQLITTDRMELNQILKEKIAQNTHNVVE